MRFEVLMGIAFKMGQILWDFISQCEMWYDSVDPDQLASTEANWSDLHCLQRQGI